MGCGLAKGEEGALDSFECPIVLGLAGEAWTRVTFARDAVSLVIGAAAVLGVRTGLTGAGASRGDIGAVGQLMGAGGVVGRKSLTLGTGPIDSSISVAQSNRLGLHAILSAVRTGAGTLSSRLFPPIPSFPVSGVTTAVRLVVAVLLESVVGVSSAADVAVAGAVMVVVAVVVTGWTLDWVRTGVRKMFP